ncbi:hypothetical protein H2201_000382 [Coniosporium apollinis]|uniref:S1-like domain-containing protein n=2 Tax=Coniosporium TaxID=2810619 RepID=A0ABQ9P4Q4_9PEZI|nr:hypothetical protein H2199_003570 [Cladosporium sp. JES 115]KAJ9669515.1 hypothetical protein H2201_000382 [Coniosporium apollinis]
MARPKRNLLATAEETSTPPATLSEGQTLARVTKAAGNNLYAVELPSGQSLLVELPARFRSTIWIKRGSYVLVDTGALADRENKLDGEIINVVRDEKEWRKQSYWPVQFAKKSAYEDDSEDESTVGKMPPSDSDEES